MKTFLTICIFLQGISPPPLVKETFSKMFPDIISNSLKYEYFNYIATFQINGKKTSTKIATDGKWKETETESSVFELPMEVQNSYNKDFGTEVHHDGKIERANSKVVYFIETLQDDSSLRIVFSEKGNSLS